ncbi:sensor domain-containing diguanylate cyclase [Maridesulfovibrio zosterae]|uniref:sensor domain-containing diguanylate cyclase n=1 Tax=Maridesulfovibrio zosterae TaxID=82171 RepID=UPI000408AED7|nr:sensor domain-containing diguanylate cyclase [Maridesulfovibrio zosterae]
MTIDKFDFEATLLTTNFATRLLAMQINIEVLIDRALEAFCDLGSCKNATLIMYDEKQELKGIAASVNGQRFLIDEELTMTEAMMEAAKSLKPVIRPVCNKTEFPLPTDSCCKNNTCLCVPLVGSRDSIRGFVTLYREKSKPWEISELFQLGIVSTVAAISFENSELFRQTIEDSLTGLYLRRYLFIRLEEEIQRLKRRGGSISIIMLDIDHFKRVNDTYGHDIGDKVLKAVGKVLKESCRTGVDLPCRYGGEEFAVMMPGSTKEEAEVVAERIRLACEKTVISTTEYTIKVTLSSGVASVNECKTISGDTLMKKADKRLYRAKKTGRNKIVCVDC